MGFLKKMGNNIKLNLKKRNTSFELMRIIAMLMVCAYHWQLHGNNDMIPRSFWIECESNYFFYFWLMGSFRC